MISFHITVSDFVEWILHVASVDVVFLYKARNGR